MVSGGSLVLQGLCGRHDCVKEAHAWLGGVKVHKEPNNYIWALYILIGGVIKTFEGRVAEIWIIGISAII